MTGSRNNLLYLVTAKLAVKVAVSVIKTACRLVILTLCVIMTESGGCFVNLGFTARALEDILCRIKAFTNKREDFVGPLSCILNILR